MLPSAGRQPLAPELDWSWKRLQRTGGTIAIGALAAEVGWSRRHLTARFSHEFGLSPKVAARVIRFDRARRLLPHRRGDLASVAARCGYADQAHMIREFHQFCGCSPTQWLAEEHSAGSLSRLVSADVVLDAPVPTNS